MNIIKYMILNGSQINENIISDVARGGHEEVVEYFSSIGIDLSPLLLPSVVYHQNKIAKWCYEHYQHQDFETYFAFHVCNSEFVLYLLHSQGLDITNHFQQFGNLAGLILLDIFIWCHIFCHYTMR